MPHGASNSESSNSTSASLVQRARAQDPDAWQRLTQLYSPLVYGWTRQAGLSPSDAADIVQEVFRSVVANLARFRHDDENSSFRGWLWTITKNQIRLHYRQLGKRPVGAGGSENQQWIASMPDLLEQDTDPSSADAETSLVHRALRAVRDDFAANTWQAFWRLTVEGHSAADIANDLDMNPRAVRQAKYRVLTRLRQELADG